MLRAPNTPRLLARIALTLLVLIVAGLGTGYLAFRLSLPRLDGELRLAALGASVTVARDALGIPSIRGRSRLDVAHATGLVHAQDRLFQMDLMRRGAAGELAALVGPAALEHDRARRFHRLRATADAVLEQLTDGERALLVAYAAGVNAGYRSLRARPFEYVLLRKTPQPWQPADSLLVIFAMYLQLHDELAERARDLERLRRALPAPVLAFIAPRGTQWDAPLLGEPVELGPTPPPAVCDLRALASPAGSPPAPAGGSAAAVGSNAWAVSSRRSGAGALLANDMHLELRVPNIWYRARLRVDPGSDRSLDLIGLTLPGTPALIAGSNRHIAWGFTNSYGRWAERVQLDLHPEDPTRYRTPEGYAPLVVLDEVIEVAGAAPVVVRVRTSRHGPVLEEPGLGTQAVRWIAHRPEFTNLRLMALEQVTSVEQALDLAPEVGLPPQNLHVADRAGNIGWTIIGRIPLRVAGEWHGVLAPAAYPRIQNPREGILWSANARTVDGAAYELIGDGGYPLGARARQIRERLRGLGAPAIADMLAIQLDDEAHFLERWRSLLLDTLEAQAAESALAPALVELAHAVRGWNGRARPAEAGYRLVSAFRSAVAHTVVSALFACATGPAPLRADWLHQHEAAVWRLVQSRPPHLLDPRHASWHALLVAAASTALAGCAPGPVAHCTWSEVNHVRITHPLRRLLPEWLGGFLDVHDAPLPGGTHVPRVQVGRHGASQRFAVSPGDERNGYLHMPGGQSGHPLSPYFRAGHRAWVEGRPTAFLPGPARHRLVLLPAAPGAPDQAAPTSSSSQAR